MKATSSIRLLLPALLWLTSCGLTRNIQPEDFFRDKKSYEEDKPFRMTDDVIDAPLLSRKSQVYLATNMGHGVGTDIAVAVSRNLIVSGGFSFDKMGSERQDNTVVKGYYSDSTIYSERLTYQLDNILSTQSGHLAVGWYRSFGKAGRNEHYLGMATGKTVNTYRYHPISGDGWDLDPNDLTYSYEFTETRSWTRFYFQENLGFVTRRTEGALMARLSYLRFNSREIKMYYPQETRKMIREVFALHPGLKFGCGGERFRMQLLVNWSVPLSQSSDMSWYPSRVSVGAVLRLGRPQSTAKGY